MFSMNPFDILGVSVRDSYKQIKKAFRKSALKHHPDRNPDNPLAAYLFGQAKDAFDTIKSNFSSLENIVYGTPSPEYIVPVYETHQDYFSCDSLYRMP